MKSFTSALESTEEIKHCFSSLSVKIKKKKTHTQKNIANKKTYMTVSQVAMGERDSTIYWVNTNYYLFLYTIHPIGDTNGARQAKQTEISQVVRTETKSH